MDEAASSKKTEKQEADRLRRLQKKLEREARKKARARFKQALLDKDASNTVAGMTLVEELIWKAMHGLEWLINERDENNGGPVPFWYMPFLEIKPELTADLAIRTILDAQGKNWTYKRYIEFAGKAFAALYVQQIVEGNSDRKRKFDRFEKKMVKQFGSTERRVSIYWKYARELGFSYDSLKADPTNCNEQEKGWTPENQRIVGAALLNIVLYATDSVEIEKIKKEDDEHPTRYLTLCETLKQKLEKKNIRLENDSAFWYGPMVTPPSDWGLDNHGPYTDDAQNHTLDFVRNMSKPQAAYVENALHDGSMQEVLNAVNTVQKVLLHINPYVLDAVEWVRAENLQKQVKYPTLDETPIPDKLPDDVFQKLPMQDQMDIAGERSEILTDNDATKGNITNIGRHMAQARELLELDIPGFYLPHNCDYRGRVYTIPDFNFQKADHMRGLFLFANKTEVNSLTVSDIHFQIANAWGNKIDKLTYEGREEWAVENLDMILAVGKDFTSTFDLWREADEPFQFLAGCRERYNYEQHGDGYLTGLPIPLDATQSGVQHYALALRHTDDAARVNFAGPEQKIPNDFYLECLEKAKDLIEATRLGCIEYLESHPVTEQDELDYAEHLAFIQNYTETTFDERKEEKARWRLTDAYTRLKKRSDLKCAEMVQAYYDAEYLPYNRSVIKRNCMTYCYSSRQYGFSQQLKKDWLNEISKLVRDPEHPLKEHPFGADRGFALSTFLGTIHQRAIESIISSARIGMEYICKLTRVTGQYDLHLQFVNPAGFPMFQHYVEQKKGTQKLPFFDRNLKKINKNTNFLIHRVPVLSEDGEEIVDVDSSVDACSPNVIHSMDSCHLAKTINLCSQRGIADLLVIHDSFATTVGNVSKMAAIIKYSIAELYNNYNLYEDLRTQTIERIYESELAKRLEELEPTDDEEENVEITHELGENLVFELRQTIPDTPDLGTDFNWDLVKRSIFSFS